MSQSDAFVIHEQDCELEGSDDSPFEAVRWRTLISADRTPTNSLTVGVAELEPGESKHIRRHKHAHPEVYYILSGEGIVTVSGTDHQVRPGTCIFISGDAEHATQNTGSELLRLLYVFPSDSFAEINYEYPDA